MAEPPIYVPPLVSETVTRALTERHQRGGLAGVTRTAALTAVELAQSPITSPEVVRRVHDWHSRHPEHTTPDGRATLLGSVWGGRAGRDWAADIASRLAAASPPKPDAPMAAGLAVVAADTGRVLLQQRALVDDSDPNAGTWETPGGTIDPGEDALDAARREFAEETGTPVPGRLVGDYTSPNGLYRLFVHAVENEADVPINVDPEDRQFTDPDGDYVETCCWWDPKHLEDNPALRPEATWTPWEELVALAGPRTAAIAEPLDIIRTIPGNAPRAKQRATLKRLSKRLAAIDRDTRAKLRAGAEVAMASGLRRAGVKVAERARKRSKAVQASIAAANGHYTPAVLAAVGITEQEALARAFDDYGELATTYLTDAQRRRFVALADELDLDPDELEADYGPRASAGRDAAVGFLLSGLSALALSRLAEPHPLQPNQGEEVQSTIPGSLIFQSMALADDRPTRDDGQMDQFGQGLTFDIVASDVSDITETITWIWGGSAHPFEGHLALDGTSTTAADMEGDWANPEDWPPFPYYFPADHDACSCSWESAFDVPDVGGGE